jgi:uncharacterized protein involved in tolerance to divalent cations
MRTKRKAKTLDSSTESPTNSFVELILTCSSWQEAHDIAEVLLKKGLIATAEFLPVPSRHHRLKRAFEKTEEIKLIMRSISAYYSGIESRHYAVKDLFRCRRLLLL